MATEPTVLFVDDERNVLSALERHLVREPYRRLFTTSAHEGLAILDREAVQVVVSDMRMPEMEGLLFLQKVREQHPAVIRIVLSGTSEIQRVVGAINSGEIFRYITKPINELAEFRAILRQALELYALQQQKTEFVAQLEETNQRLSRWRERVARDLEVAGQMQRRLLSATPLFSPAGEVWWTYRPSMSVGGDFFDAVSMPDGRLCVYVGDVAGHGVGPAMLSTLMKVITTDMILDTPAIRPAELCRQLNRFACSHLPSDEFFVTFFVAILDPVAGRWTACNCGHPRPFLLGPQAEWLRDRIPDEGELPLGMNAATPFGPEAEISWPAAPGEILLLFTDGLYEARQGGTGEPCGEERLQALAQALADPSQPLPHPNDLLARLAAEGYQLEGDDCCAAMIRLAVPAELLWQQTFPAHLAAVDQFAAACEQRLMQAGWAERPAQAARLVAMEYGTHIVRHGQPPPGALIDAQLRLRGPYAYLFFRDSGPPWDSARQLAPVLPVAAAESGRGLNDIRAGTIRREIFRRDDGNHGYFVVSASE
jgi:serine phosphatase RsbU (regulator of sigma subunit)